MNRQSLIQLLIGIIAALTTLAALNAVRQDRCLDAGGQWVAATRACIGPEGPLQVARGSDFVVAVVIGILLAFMLHRASTFARRGRSS